MKKSDLISRLYELDEQRDNYVFEQNCLDPEEDTNEYFYFQELIDDIDSEIDTINEELKNMED